MSRFPSPSSFSNSAIGSSRSNRSASSGRLAGQNRTIVAPSAYFMKSPPRQIPDDRARQSVEDYIRGTDLKTLGGQAVA